MAKKVDKEKLIKSIMKRAELDGEPVTREEAEEMAEMEIKAKDILDYAQAEEKKPRKKREVKKDPIKVDFIKFLLNLLLTNGIDNAIIVNEQKEIAFRIGEDNYSLSLIKHRAPKEKEN
jgi:hypothetical protein